ncbi:MAG: hypothetical protein ACTHLJ_09585 [Angustibacter sp.]
MTTSNPVHHTTAHDPVEAARSTRAAWLMVPVWVAMFIATSYAGVVVLDWLGLGEGDLWLFAHNVWGWVAEIGFAILLAAPAAVGVAYAVRALRRGGRGLAGGARAVNALLLALVLYMFADAVRMTYWPGD